MARPRSDIGPRIVHAARRRFLVEGVDGASLRAIAHDARTSIGMIYYYFPTKDDLFLAVVEEMYVTVLADMKTVRTIVDNEGKYGRKGDSHTLTETTTFRDRWVKVSDKWKMKSREQVKAPTVSVGKTDRAA